MPPHPLAQRRSSLGHPRASPSLSFPKKIDRAPPSHAEKNHAAPALAFTRRREPRRAERPPSREDRPRCRASAPPSHAKKDRAAPSARIREQKKIAPRQAPTFARRKKSRRAKRPPSRADRPRCRAAHPFHAQMGPSAPQKKARRERISRRAFVSFQRLPLIHFSISATSAGWTEEWAARSALSTSAGVTNCSELPPLMERSMGSRVA